MADARMHRMFRGRELAERIVDRIRETGVKAKIMHVCGTHEQSIARSGLRSLLPEGLEIVPGPGCPVCVTPTMEIDAAVKLAEQGAIVTVYGDMMRVPGTMGSLEQKKIEGFDCRIVYSPENAVEVACQNPGKEVVFFAIGLETTAPMTSDVLLNSPPENFSVLCSHRLTPPAVDFLLSLGESKINGLIEPGHVSTIIGEKAWIGIDEKYGVSQVIAGFEPIDILTAVRMITRQLKNGESFLENEYKRSVSYEGNLRAQEAMKETFNIKDEFWRGFPVIPKSTMEIKKEFQEFDSTKKFDIDSKAYGEACGVDCPLCGDILRGLANPPDCPKFSFECTPSTPLGACMVSSEGTCNIAFRYGGLVKL
jgi:hydrogenase expression/formation protein HypD